jgi:hypothetical protein
MKRLATWWVNLWNDSLDVRLGYYPRCNGRVIDLPEQFGPRLKMENVQGTFRHDSNRETLNTVAQLLWMHRTEAAERAMDAAMDGKTNKDFHLGQMGAIDNALADFQKLMDAKDGDAAPASMAKWFKK